MANKVRKSEHGGAKHAKGHWGRKKEAKAGAKKLRRSEAKAATWFPTFMELSCNDD